MTDAISIPSVARRPSSSRSPALALTLGMVGIYGVLAFSYQANA